MENTKNLSQNDKPAFELAQKGDLKAFFTLVKPSIPGMYQILFQMHPDRAVAVKLANDVLVALWEQIPNLKTSEAFPNWMKEVVIAHAVYHVPEADSSKSFLTIAAQSVDFTPLEKEIRKMTPVERKALFLFNRYGYSLDRIAKMLEGETTNSLREKLGSILGRTSVAADFQHITPLSAAQLETLIEADNQNTTLPIVNQESDASIYAEYKALTKDVKSTFVHAGPPETLLNDLRAVLEATKQSKTKKAKTQAGGAKANPLAQLHLFANEKKSVSLSGVMKKAFAAALVIALLGGLYFGYQKLFGATTPWALEQVSGIVSVSSGHNTRVNEGETLNTGASSSVAVVLPDIGEVTLQSNGRMNVESARRGSVILSLPQGVFSFRSSTIPTAPETFPIDNLVLFKTGFGVIATRFSQLSVRNDSGTVILDVEKGWADYKTENNACHLKSNYSLNLSNEKSVPFRTDAPAEIIALSAMPDSFSVMLPNALAQCTNDDLLTLWHLLPRVSEADKNAIRGRIEELLPPVKGLIQLNPNEMKFLLGFAMGN